MTANNITLGAIDVRIKRFLRGNRRAGIELCHFTFTGLIFFDP